MSTLPFHGQRVEALMLVNVVFAKTDTVVVKDSKSRNVDLLFTFVPQLNFLRERPKARSAMRASEGSGARVKVVTPFSVWKTALLLLSS